MLAAGSFVGLLTGFLGVGGGFLIVPALVKVGGLGMCQTIRTSLVVIAMSSVAGLAAHLANGDAPSVGLADPTDDRGIGRDGSRQPHGTLSQRRAPASRIRRLRHHRRFRSDLREYLNGDSHAEVITTRRNLTIEEMRC